MNAVGNCISMIHDGCFDAFIEPLRFLAGEPEELNLGFVCSELVRSGRVSVTSEPWVLENRVERGSRQIQPSIIPSVGGKTCNDSKALGIALVSVTRAILARKVVEFSFR